MTSRTDLDRQLTKRQVEFESAKSGIQTQIIQLLQFRADSQLALLRSLVILNGGALIAILTLIGNSESNLKIDATRLGSGIEWLMFGAALAVIGFQFHFQGLGLALGQLFKVKQRLSSEFLGNDGPQSEGVDEARAHERSTVFVFLFYCVTTASGTLFLIGSGLALKAIAF